MASAVMPGNNNDHYWSRHKNNATTTSTVTTSYMNNYDSTPDFRRRQLPNNNPNPNRNPPPENNAAATLPCTTSFSNSDNRKYVTYHINSYSRRELKELRKRLMSELDQVRSVRTRLETLPDRNSAPPPPKVSTLTMQQVSKSKANMMRRCSQMLTKLMKHKHGWVFNKPVDVVSLGLHDYHTIVKHPMDLGTVKSRMLKKEYKTPLDFAGDVRLTFSNAMLYNPKGQDVYLMAHDLLMQFENMFKPAFEKYEGEIFGGKKKEKHKPRLEPAPEDRRPQVGAPVGYGAKVAGKGMVRKRDLSSEGKSRKRDIKEEKSRKREKLAVNVEVESRKVDEVVLSEKRDMTFDEKSKLAVGLQELPQPKLDEMVKIIKKRNMHLAPDSDEIEMELDIEVIDNETLWELQKLVEENEKMVQRGANVESSAQNEMFSGMLAEEKNKKGDAGEEEVDIGDEAPVNFPPLEIEKDGSSSGSASSSSVCSSSSSDSDSSGSESDGESVHSPFVEARGDDPEMS